MNYKLLAADMDGTLLNDQSQVSEHTRKTVLHAMARGMLFVPSTGRPMCGMGYIQSLFPGDLPYILFNGAFAMTGESKKVLFAKNLGVEHAKEIYDLGMARGIPVVMWVGEKLCVSHDCPAIQEYRAITSAPMFAIEAFHNVTKMLWLPPTGEALRWQDEMNRHFEGRVNCHTSRPHILEFVDAGASKGLALAAIGAAYGIAREEMIAVGDGWNDAAMLEYAGLGVAMGNAPAGIKNLCDEVTASNQEDGVAKVVERYWL